MKRLAKVISTITVTLLLMVSAQQAAGWWGGPWHGARHRHAYIHDPAYRHAPPAMKRHIRDLYRYGPGYSYANPWRHGWGRHFPTPVKPAVTTESDTDTAE